MKISTTCISALLALAMAAPAAIAQPDGDEVELGDEPLPETGDSGNTGELGGVDENPDAPRLGADETLPSKGDDKAAPAEDGPYPLEVARRPLTLHAGMSEVGIELRALAFDATGDAGPVVAGSLRARYGVTREIEVGLRYGGGALVKDEFETGKSIGIDGRYLIEDWVAGQIAIPILLDPFGIGVELGAPMIFRFDKFALIAGEDLLAIKLSRLIPNVENAALTAGAVALDEIGTESHEVELRLLGGVIYQHKENMAITARAGIVSLLGAPDAVENQQLRLLVDFTHSSSNKMDLGARIFVLDFNNFGDTAGLGVFANLRI